MDFPSSSEEANGNLPKSGFLYRIVPQWSTPGGRRASVCSDQVWMEFTVTAGTSKLQGCSNGHPASCLDWFGKGQLHEGGRWRKEGCSYCKCYTLIGGSQIKYPVLYPVLV